MGLGRGHTRPPGSALDRSRQGGSPAGRAPHVATPRLPPRVCLLRELDRVSQAGVGWPEPAGVLVLFTNRLKTHLSWDPEHKHGAVNSVPRLAVLLGPAPGLAFARPRRPLKAERALLREPEGSQGAVPRACRLRQWRHSAPLPERAAGSWPVGGPQCSDHLAALPWGPLEAGASARCVRLSQAAEAVAQKQPTPLARPSGGAWPSGVGQGCGGCVQNPRGALREGSLW